MHPTLSLVGHFCDGLSMVSVRAQPHNAYISERVGSSAAHCQGFAPDALVTGMTVKATPEVL